MSVRAISFTFLILFAVVANHHFHACSQKNHIAEKRGITGNKKVYFNSKLN